MVPKRLSITARALPLWGLLVFALSLGSGCGGADSGEIEITSPVQVAPMYNPTPTKSGMSHLTEENEAEYIDKIPGAVAR